jgi:hypothetical protein
MKEISGVSYMSTIGISRELMGISPGDAYEATLKKLPELGFIIWKTRPLAWLIIANRDLTEGKVNATVSFRPGNGATLSISLACETMKEDALQTIGSDLVDAIVSLFPTTT